MRFLNQNINDFIKDLGSDMPSPGGGAVAGLVGALSGALNSMVYSLTVGKKSYNELDDSIKQKIKNFQDESEKFTVVCLTLMDEDRKNFLGLMDSYKLPKDTEEEKVKRALSIKINTKKAMEAPLALVREGIKFYDNLRVMLEYGNKMLLSDLQMSAILLHCAIESSVINVKINLNSLKNEEYFDSLNSEIEKILEDSLKQKAEICTSIENKL